MNSNGIFIVLDGPDGSGTTKQSELLTDSLRNEGYDVVRTAEPTSNPLGQHIRTMLKQEKMIISQTTLQLLFCADRAQHIADTISPALQEGKIIVCDRYEYSTFCYGAAFGLNVSWLKNVNAPFPKPHVTLFTLPPFEVCKERLQRRESTDLLEEEALQKTVYDLYEKLAKEDDIICVDTSGEKQVTAKRILGLVLPFLPSV